MGKFQHTNPQKLVSYRARGPKKLKYLLIITLLFLAQDILEILCFFTLFCYPYNRPNFGLFWGSGRVSESRNLPLNCLHHRLLCVYTFFLVSLLFPNYYLRIINRCFYSYTLKVNKITTYRAAHVTSKAAGGGVTLCGSPLASTSKTRVVSYLVFFPLQRMHTR